MIVHWLLVRLRPTVAHYVSLSDQVSKSDTSQADCWLQFLQLNISRIAQAQVQAKHAAVLSVSLI